jgi:hypothetical protein
MPNIPDIPTARRQPAPSLSSPLRDVRLASIAANVSTEAALVATRAIGAREEARRKGEFASLDAQAQKIIGDEALNAMKLPPHEAEGEFLEFADQRLRALVEGVEDETVREALEERLPGLVETRRFNVAQDAFRRETAQGRDDLQDNVLPGLAEEFGRAQNDVEREQIASSALRDIRLSDYFDAAEKKKLAENWQAASEEARVLRLLDDENPAGAEALLKDRKLTGKIPDDRRLALRGTIERDLARAGERVASNLEIAINRATPADDLDALEQAIEFNFEDNAITGIKRTQLFKILDEKRAEIDELVAGRERVWSALDGETLLMPRNKDDRELVAEFYSSTIEPQVAQMDPDQRRTALVKSVVRLNMVPQPLEEKIQAQLRGGTTQQTIEAAELVELMRNSEKPELLSDFSNEDIATGMMISSFMRGGLDGESAVKRARDNLRASPQERQIREDIYVAEAYGEQNVFSEIEKRFATRGTNPSVPDGMRGEYEFLVKQIFLGTGEIDVAREQAELILNRKWAVTEIHSKRYQRLAPEVMYPEFGGNSEAIQEQLVADLLAASIKGELTLPDDFEENIRLEPDARTERQQFPSYVVSYQDEAGEWVPIEMKDGGIARFRPEFATSPLALKEEQRRAKETSGLREARRVKLAQRRFQAEHPELAELPLLVGGGR